MILWFSFEMQCNKNMHAVQIMQFSKIEKSARVLSAYDSPDLY